MFYLENNTFLSGWWQLKYFLFSTLFGEDEPNLTHIFQMGWNHQEFQVPKMEGFLNLIAGHFGDGFSLT